MNNLEVVGQYQTQNGHILPRSPLDEALAGMEGAATKFSLDAINDAQTRASYAANIKRMSAQVRADVAAGRISSQEGVQFCHEMRNKIMAEHRKITSITGLAKAQQHKKTPPTLPHLFEKYATNKYGKSYEVLSVDQKQQIHYEIIESSGRDNAKFTKGSDRLRIMGKVGILVTAAFATYEILNADNKIKETARPGDDHRRRCCRRVSRRPWRLAHLWPGRALLRHCRGAGRQCGWRNCRQLGCRHPG